uniref:SEC7 domain-containing protein n=1 Tax=Ditylenchus dipsaci TaxID=166011 RepID=A0A915D093_9BILA
MQPAKIEAFQVVLGLQCQLGVLNYPQIQKQLPDWPFTYSPYKRALEFLIDDTSLKVSHEFLALFNFAGKRLDTALREFLDHVQLAGESSDRARLLAHFPVATRSAIPLCLVVRMKFMLSLVPHFVEY